MACGLQAAYRQDLHVKSLYYIHRVNSCNGSEMMTV